ncbi:hypothetical protein NLU13_7061 [Sarocladium strictum]|uniref:Uncharacterized protein n=1 Tax=Sarocladium strictum TaxID=5046 RepID=A0AA39GG42_SARSR|nr:hypothetical protein NLU13_7061 [Sarocladium strictum]
MVVADAAAAAQGLQPSLRGSSMARQPQAAAASASSSQLQPRDTASNSSSSTSQVGGSSSDAQSSPTSTRGSTAMSGSSSSASAARQNVHSPFMSKSDGSSVVVSLSATTSASHSNASDMFCFSPNDDESDMLDFSSAAHDAILHDVSSALSADDTTFHHHHHHDDFSLDDLGHFSVFEASLPPSQDDGGVGGGLGLSKRVVAPAYGMSKAAPAGGLDHNLILGSDHRLSSLNLSISKRLDSALALGGHESQDTPSRSDATAAPPAAHDHGANQEQHDGPKLLSEALNDTSEFLIIIQSYRNRAERRGSSSWSNSGGGGDHSGEQSSPGPRLGLVNTLNLLSVYLQLVELYDKLFQSSFSFLLQDASAEGVVLDRQEAAAASSLPSIGFSPSLMQQRGGGLQAKVLIHAILHQFENIERTIGLPVDYRVTGKDDDYSGLLREGSAMNLLEAIAGESQPHQAMEGYHAELKSVGSLRTILQRMQIALNM